MSGHQRVTIHLIEVSDFFNTSSLPAIRALAALRTRYFPPERRTCTCSPFLTATLDYAHAAGHYACMTLLPSSPLAQCLSSVRLGAANLEQLTEMLLIALDLTPENIHDFPPTGTYPLTTNLTPSRSEMKMPMAWIEHAFNQQLQINSDTIRAYHEWARDTQGPICFINTENPCHTMHMITLLQGQGLNISHDTTSVLATDPGEQHQLLHYPSPDHGTLTLAEFLRTCANGRDFSYYSSNSDQVILLRRTGTHAQLPPYVNMDARESRFIECS